MSHKHDRSQILASWFTNKSKWARTKKTSTSTSNPSKMLKIHRHTNGYTVHLFYCKPWRQTELRKPQPQTKASVPSVLIMLSSTGLFLGAWPCNAHAIKRLGSCSPRRLHRTNHGGDFGGTPVHPLKMKKSGSHVQIPESFQQTNNILSFHL